MDHIIKNFEQLATSPIRRNALEIAEAGYAAINTEKIIKQSLSLDGKTLKIKDQVINLENFEKIYVLGVGKASCDGIVALNDLLKNHITSGIAIDVKSVQCDNPNIRIFEASHPKPTLANISATMEIFETAKEINEKDLVICLVSGGGSSLLCGSQEECTSDILIYDQFLKTGGSIRELNTLRKHISSLHGGGMAKLLYPATVVSLIFSDIPGGHWQQVASGPTFKDETTLEDVDKIMGRYGMEMSQIKFYETSKEDKYFEKVINVFMVSNLDALSAMENKAKDLGYATKIVTDSAYGKIPDVAKQLNENVDPKQCLLAGGEPSLTVYHGRFGRGGRCQQLAIESVPYLKQGQVFIGFASDGIDNTDAAGAIIDENSLTKISQKRDLEKEKTDLNAYPVFESIDDLIKTGPTGSNVSDLMIALKD